MVRLDLDAFLSSLLTILQIQIRCVSGERNVVRRDVEAYAEVPTSPIDFDPISSNHAKFTTRGSLELVVNQLLNKRRTPFDCAASSILLLGEDEAVPEGAPWVSKSEPMKTNLYFPLADAPADNLALSTPRDSSPLASSPPGTPVASMLKLQVRPKVYGVDVLGKDATTGAKLSLESNPRECSQCIQALGWDPALASREASAGDVLLAYERLYIIWHYQALHSSRDSSIQREGTPKITYPMGITARQNGENWHINDKERGEVGLTLKTPPQRPSDVKNAGHVHYGHEQKGYSLRMG
ncbi:hypothetical protein BKA70DRAFT_1409375 [Coprinopsis sp. MPI-PUGE-AT-0042]|nr:hypothetical protein BKA70DRAFT_1409375 [Coprinopsis sp. MPI-PUGE-AT-0042]